MLQRGRGSKARYNGAHAKLLERSGGWARVKTIADAEVVKWRSGSWQTLAVPHEQLFDLLSSGEDGLVGFILGFLEVRDVRSALQTCRHIAAAAASPATFGSCAVVQPGPRAFSMLRELAARRTQLRLLEITVGIAEIGIVKWLLHKCDVDGLQEVRIKFIRGEDPWMKHRCCTQVPGAAYESCLVTFCPPHESPPRSVTATLASLCRLVDETRRCAPPYSSDGNRVHTLACPSQPSARRAFQSRPAPNFPHMAGCATPH